MLFLVIGLVVFYSLRYRRKAGETDEPQQFHTHSGLEIGILAATTGVMGIFFFLTITTMLAVNDNPAPDRPPDLVIIGHQWWWEARYPNSGVVTANEIHIPSGKRLLVEVRSADVIHDWWVPELGRKMDMIPGTANHLWMEARHPGTFLGTCSEFCGTQHAWMRIQVIAQAPDAFAAWERAQLQKPTAVNGAVAAAGETLFQQKTCANCHAIAGTKANARIGPDLTHLGSRNTLLTGMLENTPENLTRWLDNPQQIKSGAHMPNFIFTKAEVEALVEYLEHLD
ncbi:cytochrome c oxidase subunit II [Salmonirosea aquatica]|uniref:cytochrome c oxidase subunit II n=1 Tax=Salmonirosea aquatica TaxID=2654236 RepID=UPI00357165CD